MRKNIVLIIVLIISLSGCRLALGEFPPIDDSTEVQQISYATLDCIDTFSIHGIVYTTKKVALPVTIYNPNMYTIVITVNGSALLAIPAHSEERLTQ